MVDEFLFFYYYWVLLQFIPSGIYSVIFLKQVKAMEKKLVDTTKTNYLFPSSAALARECRCQKVTEQEKDLYAFLNEKPIEYVSQPNYIL